MSVQDIIRAWKDASYRSSLSEHELILLPAHPAGAIELHASELERVFGAVDQEALIGDCHTNQGSCWETNCVQQRFLSDSVILCC